MAYTLQCNSAKPQLHGASYSVYVRIIILTLLEKQVDFNLHEMDVFDEKGISDDYLKLNPFGKIPTFSHDDFIIYETTAITRYIEDSFAPPCSLYPKGLKDRARVNQIISILDNYAYKTLVWDIYVAVCESEAPDIHKIEQALELASICLQAGRYLVGDSLSMADIHAAPIFDYFIKSPQGQKMLKQYPKLSSWWGGMAKRPNCQTAKNYSMMIIFKIDKGQILGTGLYKQ